MRLTKGALKLLATTEDNDSNTQVDRVVEVLPPGRHEPTTEDIARNTLISRIFGDDILHDPAKVHAIVKAQIELNEEMGHFRESALNMGRIFLDVKNVLSHGEFAKAMRHAPEIFKGLSRGNVWKLMNVAEAWDNGRFPQDRAPQHYTVLYEFTTLKRDQLQLAIDQGIFNPEVTRSAITKWKTKLLEPEPDGNPLEEELNQLRKRRIALLTDAIDIRKRMREIKAILENQEES